MPEKIQETLHTHWTTARTTMSAKECGEVLFVLTYEPSVYHKPDPYPWKLAGCGAFDALGIMGPTGGNALWFASRQGAEYRALSEFIEAQAAGSYHV